MSKIIAPVPKDLVVDSRRNIVGAGLVVFFGEQGDDPIETAEDIYAKVDGVETSIGKFVEIKENGQFYYNDNPVSIFIQGSINKYVSCGLYQKIGNKLSQIDYITSLAAFTAAQEQALDLVQNIRAKAGYKRHFQTMKEAKEYQGYYLNQVVFISEVNDEPQLAGQFIIKSSDDNIVDSITNFSIVNSSYVLQRITGAYPYKNTLEVTARSIDDIHKFMYHLKIAGNFKCTLVVDYDFVTENLDLTIFKKVIFNKFVPTFKGISAREVVFNDGGSNKEAIFYVSPQKLFFLSDVIPNGQYAYEDEYDCYHFRIVKWIIINCQIESVDIKNYHGLYISGSNIKSFSGTQNLNTVPTRAEMDNNSFRNEFEKKSAISLIISSSKVNINNCNLLYKFFPNIDGVSLYYRPIDSYAFIQSKICIHNCNLSAQTNKNGYIYETITRSYRASASAFNPLIESSNILLKACNVTPSFNYIYYANEYEFYSKTSGISLSNSMVSLDSYPTKESTLKMKYKTRTYYTSGKKYYYMAYYDGIVFSNAQSISPFVSSLQPYNIRGFADKGVGVVVLVYNTEEQALPFSINSIQYYTDMSNRYITPDPNAPSPFTSKFTMIPIPYQEMPIWSDAIRQNSTNVIEGTALPGFLSVGELPKEGEINYTPVPTD